MITYSHICNCFLSTKVKSKSLNRVERVKGFIWWRLQSIITLVLEKKTRPRLTQNFQSPILRAKTKICLSNAIVLKFGEDHHDDKWNLSCKFHQYPSWGRYFLKFYLTEGHHQGWKRPSPTRILMKFAGNVSFIIVMIPSKFQDDCVTQTDFSFSS